MNTGLLTWTVLENFMYIKYFRITFFTSRFHTRGTPTRAFFINSTSGPLAVAAVRAGLLPAAVSVRLVDVMNGDLDSSSGEGLRYVARIASVHGGRVLL